MSVCSDCACTIRFLNKKKKLNEKYWFLKLNIKSLRLAMYWVGCCSQTLRMLDRNCFWYRSTLWELYRMHGLSLWVEIWNYPFRWPYSTLCCRVVSLHMLMISIKTKLELIWNSIHFRHDPNVALDAEQIRTHRWICIFRWNFWLFVLSVGYSTGNCGPSSRLFNSSHQ